jgi:hypothetical protein
MRAFWHGSENAQKERQRKRQPRRNRQMAAKTTPIDSSVLAGHGGGGSKVINVNPSTGSSGVPGPSGGTTDLATEIPSPKK